VASTVRRKFEPWYWRLRRTNKILTGATHLFIVGINFTEHEADISLSIYIRSANWKILGSEK